MNDRRPSFVVFSAQQRGPRPMWRAAAIALTLGWTGAAWAGTEPLGRLFFMPEQRIALERQRHASPEKIAPPEQTTLTLDGVVRRSSGKNTVWVNGVPYADRQTQSGVRVDIVGSDPGRGLVAAGKRPLRSLGVGESIELRSADARVAPQANEQPK
jgi:hypothetical protein